MATLAPLATFDDAATFGSGPEILNNLNEVQGLTLMLRATRNIENRCQRKLAPFVGLVETHRAQGVDQDVFGSADMPMNLQAALGYSQSQAFSATSMVRDFMLDQYPPVDQDLWAYNVQSVGLQYAYGGTAATVSNITGPDIDTGHVRFNLGTFCPIGTTIKITYDGGYSVAIPDDLALACIFTAYRFAIVGAEPQTRKDTSLVDVDAEIMGLIAPYIRT